MYNYTIEDYKDYKATTEAEDLFQLVSFKLGTEEFGVDILDVQEINRMTEITTVPQAPEFVEGVINLRGKVIPIVDLRKRVDMGVKEYDKDTRIVVVNIEKNTVGLIVDSVSEVLRIPKSSVEPPPSMISGLESDFLTDVLE
jgi:purine-binding chemotaxis protein CheW